jgi:hypothetical protein
MDVGAEFAWYVFVGAAGDSPIAMNLRVPPIYPPGSSRGGYALTVVGQHGHSTRTRVYAQYRAHDSIV